MRENNIKRLMLCLFAIGGVLLLGLVITIFVLGAKKQNALIYSIAPSNDKEIYVYAHKGMGLLNVPVYITIQCRYTSFPGKDVEIMTSIDNDDNPVTAQSKNINIVWEDSTAYIILEGTEQQPETIAVFFGDQITWVADKGTLGQKQRDGSSVFPRTPCTAMI